jgi:hypothetical protein
MEINELIAKVSENKSELSDEIIEKLNMLKWFYQNKNCPQKISMIGRRYGALTVIKESEPCATRKNEYISRWECLCDCGNTITKKINCLSTSKYSSCGCLLESQNIIGNRYGKLTVIKRYNTERDKSGHMRSQYICKCDCGVLVIKSRHELTGRQNVTCGGKYSEQAIENAIDQTYNNFLIENKNALSHIWVDMRQRCNNPNAPHYDCYGGRGIKVCETWNKPNNKDMFLRWAFESGYKKGLSIDRINVDGDYESSNCRWVDHKTQQRNKQNTRYVVYRGEAISISELSEEFNIPYGTLLGRINHGWDIEKALTKPVGKQGKRKRA